MPIQLDHMILPVADLAQTIDFFTSILGCTYDDSFHAVGNMQGPGVEAGSRGDGESVYFFDPNQHLFEIRHYG
jgi:catechol 2,3-dioxygenase-like lactoylglutathione lyase family enzyme